MLAKQVFAEIPVVIFLANGDRPRQRRDVDQVVAPALRVPEPIAENSTSLVSCSAFNVLRSRFSAGAGPQCVAAGFFRRWDHAAHPIGAFSEARLLMAVATARPRHVVCHPFHVAAG